MSKAKAKSLSPKQATVKANSLLKGIDNSVSAIDKHQKAIKENAGQLQTVLTGLSNAAAEKPVPKKAEKAAPKKAAPKKAAPKKPEAKKPEAKKAAPKKPEAKKPEKAAPKKAAAKKPEAKKAAPKKAAAKPSVKAVVAKPPVPDRPTVKDAIRESIGSEGPDTKANLYHRVTSKYGYWSRQSFYNALKDKKSFREVDGKILDVSSRPVQTTDEEAQKFVESVQRDQTVASTA